MHDTVEKIAMDLGFALAYFLPPPSLPRPEELPEREAARGLAGSGRLFCASSVLFLVWPYVPFDVNERISAYYLASHASYCAGNKLMERVRALGADIVRAELSLRSIALENGIGDLGRSGLMSIPPYGSRIVLSAFHVSLPPREFTPPKGDPCPEGCTLCAEACPAGAIHGRLDADRCMRRFMDGASRPEWVMERQRYFLGCEACLFACAKNRGLSTAVPDASVREAFDIERLISGDCAAARALVGRNITSNGKLTCEAIVFAARSGGFGPKIRHAAERSQFTAVRSAAKWALQRFFMEK